MTVTRRIEPMALVAILFLLFIGFNILRDKGGLDALSGVRGEATTLSLPAIFQGTNGIPGEGGQGPIEAQILGDQYTIAPPYDKYTLTQGPHGFSYGHMAIDLSAGKGAVIKSPINGIVTALYGDDLLNTVLIIENDVYQVLMMHGNYTVSIGDQVALGQIVGTESNNGYTKDANGRLCYGHDCGYHTHLNIFDKRLRTNVNPLDVIGH